MNDDNGPDIVIKRSSEEVWSKYSADTGKHAIRIYDDACIIGNSLCAFTTDIRLLCKLRVLGGYIQTACTALLSL